MSSLELWLYFKKCFLYFRWLEAEQISYKQLSLVGIRFSN